MSRLFCLFLIYQQLHPTRCEQVDVELMRRSRARATFPRASELFSVHFEVNETVGKANCEFPLQRAGSQKNMSTFNLQQAYECQPAQQVC